MTTIEVAEGSRGLINSIKLLGTSSKRPGLVKALPKVCYVRPQATIDGQHLAKYAALCGLTLEHGVPFIYPQMLTFPLMMQFVASEFCPWPAMGTVHLANAIEQESCLRVGEAVRVELSTGHLFAHEKGQVFTLELRILRGNQMIWRGTQTLLRIGIKDPVGSPYVSALTSDAPLSRHTDFMATTDIGRRYGKVSGDFNPIHLSALSARLFGFRRAIAHGMWTKARALATILPAKPVDKVATSVEFKTPLLLPARPTLWIHRAGEHTTFEVRDEKGEKPHLRGRLSY